MLKFRLPDNSARIARTTVTISNNVELAYAQFWTDGKRNVYFKPLAEKEKNCLKVIAGRDYVVTGIPYEALRQTGVYTLEPATFNGSGCFRIGDKLSR